MASPQKENGYTAIANELLEQLVKARIPASEKDIIFFLLRRTYGFQKKKDYISLTQFEKGTGLSRVTVVKSLKNLAYRNMVVKAGILEIILNKDWESWVVTPPILVKARNRFGKGAYTSPSKGAYTESGKGAYTHKRKKEIYKETITKEISNASVADEISIIIKSFESINPLKVKSWYGNTTQRESVRDLLDKFGKEKLEKIIAILPKTNAMKYAPRITTPYALEMKVADLEIFLKRQRSALPTVAKIR